MNIEIIKTKYPKAYSKLEAYIQAQLNNGPSVPGNEEIEKAIRAALGIDTLMSILVSSPQQLRNLFDFFDNYEIFICISSIFSNVWSCNVNDDEIDSSINYISRIKAEDEGFMKGFELLEAKLN